jgi:dienelactone hydrolase
MRLIVMFLVLGLTAAVQAEPALWGGLKAGPYAVGFRQVEVRDAGRPFLTPRDFTGRARKTDTARPIRISVWYPAAKGTATPMTLGDYVALLGVEDRLGPVTAERARAGLEIFSTIELVRDLDAAQKDAVLRLPTLAVGHAPAAKGRFPLVLYSMGSASMGNTTPEYLASHGYVVAQAPRLGAWAGAAPNAMDGLDLITKMTDLDRTLEAMAALPEVDASNLSTVGFSAGGQWAALYAMRNPNVRAVVALDTVLLFDDGMARAFRRHPQFDWAALRVPVLHVIRKEWVPRVDKAAWAAMRHAARTDVVFEDAALHHLDLQSLGLALTLVGARADQAAAVQRAFPIWNQQLLAFLDGAQRAQTRPLPRGKGVVVAQLPAEPAPISTAEFQNLSAEVGLDQAIAAIKRSGRPGPSESDLNLAAYVLVYSGQAKAALPVFQLVAERFPKSANARDSLADAYLAVGDKVRALEETRQAKRLLDTDRDMPAERRASIQASIDDKLKALR